MKNTKTLISRFFWGVNHLYMTSGSEIVEVLLFEKMAYRASKYLDIRGISSYTIFVHEVIFPYVGSIRLVLPHKLYN